MKKNECIIWEDENKELMITMSLEALFDIVKIRGVKK